MTSVKALPLSVCGRIYELIAARRARCTPYILDAAKRLSDAALGNFSRDTVEGVSANKAKK
jgi:hypothetical protein